MKYRTKDLWTGPGFESRSNQTRPTLSICQSFVFLRIRLGYQAPCSTRSMCTFPSPSGWPTLSFDHIWTITKKKSPRFCQPPYQPPTSSRMGLRTTLFLRLESSHSAQRTFGSYVSSHTSPYIEYGREICNILYSVTCSKHYKASHHDTRIVTRLIFPKVVSSSQGLAITHNWVMLCYPSASPQGNKTLTLTHICAMEIGDLVGRYHLHTTQLVSHQHFGDEPGLRNTLLSYMTSGR